MNNRRQAKGGEMRSLSSIIVSVIFALIVIVGWLIFWPQYSVYSKEMRGRAAYAEAEQNRRIQVLEAQAAKESAAQLSEAEIIRAKGVAEANRIVAEGLGGPEGYLRYLWIQQLSQNNQNVIYVPTETGLPILEAGKRKEPKPVQ